MEQSYQIKLDSEILQAETPPVTAISYNLFQLKDSDNFYLIEMSDTTTLRNIDLLKDGELFTEDDGLFTWVIGTQLNDDMTSNGKPIYCNARDLHLWAKKTTSIQEIATKHNHIIEASLLNKEKILSQSIENEDDLSVALSDGVIDYILYAGEMRKQTVHRDNKMYCTLTINFISGTYMKDLLDVNNPSDIVRQCVSNVLMNIAQSESYSMPIELNLQFDTTGLTFINTEFGMTRDLLERYISRGAQVYEFPNKKIALEFKNLKKDLYVSEFRVGMYIRSRNDELARKEQENLDRLKSMDIEAYRYRLRDIRYGGIKTKRRKRTKKIKKNKNKRTKRRKLKSKINKRKK
jgi:hypothetical protein